MVQLQPGLYTATRLEPVSSGSKAPQLRPCQCLGVRAAAVASYLIITIIILILILILIIMVIMTIVIVIIMIIIMIIIIVIFILQCSSSAQEVPVLSPQVSSGC